jgi:hypothetical protein
MNFPDPTLFDNICKEEVIKLLDGLESKCLKEREMSWHRICGFVVEHINWFERLKESDCKWEVRGFKNDK